MQKITIIGGGLSGTLVAINLLRTNSSKEIDIKLIDKKPVGFGVAFSTEQPFHLLNVRAENMSLFPEEPEHFSKWLQEKKLKFTGKDFVPRRLYGRYIYENFEKTISKRVSSTNLDIINDEALDIIPNSKSCLIRLKSGNEIESDKVVLALGNLYSVDLNLKDNSYLNSPRYYSNPWDSYLYENLNKEVTILIIGTGLTMIDIVSNLYQINHKGKIIAVSKHGFMPFIHQLTEAYPAFYEELQNKSLEEILKIVKDHIKKENEKGNDWRGVIDSLRPHTQKIWLDLPLNERKKFLGHLKHFWNPARHRVPHECFNITEQLISKGQLKIEAGRIKKITELNNSFKIELRKGEKKAAPDTSVNKILTADVIIKCAGTENDYEKINIPIVKNLLSRGLIRKDQLSLGLDAHTTGRIIDKEGNSSKYFFTLGQPLLGILWETTAVPEIRVQAQKLASLLLESSL